MPRWSLSLGSEPISRLTRLDNLAQGQMLIDQVCTALEVLQMTEERGMCLSPPVHSHG